MSSHFSLPHRVVIISNSFHLRRFTLSLLLTLLPFIIWDGARSQPSAFLEESLKNYGGLATDIAGFGQRWLGFMELLAYGTASPLLNMIFLLGCPLLLALGGQLEIGRSAWRLEIRDWFLFLFSLAFLALYAFLSFQVWDRYLLGLIPFLALLLARILLLPRSLLQIYRPRLKFHQPLNPLNVAVGLALIWLLAATLATPIQDALNGRYPIGSNSQALHGIEQVTAYLQGRVGAGNTLYHHWLGAHWRFYLWHYPYDLQYWATPQELAVRAQPGHFIAYPAWRSDTEVRLALFEAGLRLRELLRAYALDGSPSIILYQIEPIP